MQMHGYHLTAQSGPTPILPWHAFGEADPG